MQNTAGVLLSVDLHKAFDSVFHEFMREVYKFFGFGEYFIRLSETLGNGRCAKKIFDDGKYSENIELERCRPQGDSPSPRQFNMCQQICIFKLELDPAVKSVYLSFIVCGYLYIIIHTENSYMYLAQNQDDRTPNSQL